MDVAGQNFKPVSGKIDIGGSETSEPTRREWRMSIVVWVTEERAWYESGGMEGRLALGRDETLSSRES